MGLSVDTITDRLSLLKDSSNEQVYDNLNMEISTLEHDAVLYGKYASELQSDIVISEYRISGTLNYVTGYTGFSDDVRLQSGNYLAFRAIVPNVDGVTVTVQLKGEEPITLDENGLIVLRITDKCSQIITIVASKDGYKSVRRRLSLSDLICLES